MLIMDRQKHNILISYSCFLKTRRYLSVLDYITVYNFCNSIIICVDVRWVNVSFFFFARAGRCNDCFELTTSGFEKEF